MSGKPLPVRSPLTVLRLDFPDHLITQRSIRGKLFYVAEARRPGAQPVFAQAETTERLRGKLLAAPVRELNTSEPSIARVYDVLLGGKDNFAADRSQAETLLGIYPHAADLARESRQFQARAVAYAGRRGVRQFIDLGCGLPTAPNTYQTAQHIQPDARVVYVDNDRSKSTCAHARRPVRSPDS